MIRNTIDFADLDLQIARAKTADDAIACTAALAKALAAREHAFLIVHSTADDGIGANITGFDPVVSTLTSSRESDILFSQAINGGQRIREMAELQKPYFWLHSNGQFVEFESFDRSHDSLENSAVRADSIAIFASLDRMQIGCLLVVGIRPALTVIDIAAAHSYSVRLLAKYRHLSKNRASMGLNRTQQDCLLWSARGKSSGEMAEILGLSEHTINHYLNSAAAKLDANSWTHAIARAIRFGVIEPSEIG